MPSSQSKGKGTEEGSQQLGISACHQLLVSLLTAGRLPPNQFSEEAVFKAPVLGEMGCETASVVIRTQRNLINGAFLPSLPLLHLGNSETASCLPFCWQTGRVRERTDSIWTQCEVKSQTQEVRYPVAGLNLAGEPKKGQASTRIHPYPPQPPGMGDRKSDAGEKHGPR